MSISKRHLQDTDLVGRVVQEYLSDRKPALRELAQEFSIGYHTAAEMVRQTLTKEHLAHEQRLRYSRSKTGEKNPMKGKTGDQHHNYKGLVGDSKGYLMVLKPTWFTSRPGSKHVFLHHVIFCQASGITGIPKGFTIHHIDGDKKNNSIDNLALVTMKGHARIHHPPSARFTLWEKHLSGTLK